MIPETSAASRLFSVGHSNHELVAFIELLRGAGITAVADVRSQPVSRRLPHFNGQELKRSLQEQGIAYVFLGDLLGGRPSNEELYDEQGRVDYDAVRRCDYFQRGLDRLLQGTERYIVAMMCSEADPLDCHRGLMITPALLQRSVAPLHLRRDGSVETTAEMQDRLLSETGVGEGILDGLFAPTLTDEDRDQLLGDAYGKMARAKAFRAPRGGRLGGREEEE